MQKIAEYKMQKYLASFKRQEMILILAKMLCLTLMHVPLFIDTFLASLWM